ncbi:HPr family phosphocarrier protein [Faecalicatena orotica]|uniref:HPr family phosphocarrier protein n=1 Tax=Faecalicatena orotica TaxID=1544 RepID=UPI00321726D2
MKEFKYVITDPEGIHARPAGLLVKQAAGYKSDIKIGKGEKMADAKRIFGVMGLGVKTGEEIVMTAEGEDEDTAITELEEFFKANL